MTFWRDDPALKGRFHPEYPDDLQVLVHEGSFRFTDTKPEVVWARVFALLEITTNEGRKAQAYKAILLNQPNHLKTLKVGQEILFVAHVGYQHAIRITHDYLADRASFDIEPCDKCGLPETFDPISKLSAHTFPDAKKLVDEGNFQLFSSFCPMCGGVMIVRHKHLTEIEANKSAVENQKPLSRLKKWLGKK